MNDTDQSVVYISGPMTGLPDHNYPAFNDLAAELRAYGHQVVNPAELDGGSTAQTWEWYMRENLLTLLQCTHIVFLPGWQNSKGARLESYVARCTGIKLVTAGDLAASA